MVAQLVGRNITRYIKADRAKIIRAIVLESTRTLEKTNKISNHVLLEIRKMELASPSCYNILQKYTIYL